MLTQKNLADVYHSLTHSILVSIIMACMTEQIKRKILQFPVLILRGDRDYVVTEQMTQEIVEDLGDNATYIPLENMGIRH